jgi:hypothetical protein
MGGFGSTRWGMTVTRVSTAGLLRLDVRLLARTGCLAPGASATITWGNGASISTEVSHEDPTVMHVNHQILAGNGVSLSIQDRIALRTTPCNFGSERAWFACPGCGCRCAVLYALGGRFRCRSCHHLTNAPPEVTRRL